MSDIIFLERQEDNLCENDAITTPGHFLDGSQKKFSILLEAEKNEEKKKYFLPHLLLLSLSSLRVIRFCREKTLYDLNGCEIF